MPSRARGRGNALPYELLAGVVPCPRGWLVSVGKLVGVSVYPESLIVVKNLREVLDAVPQYSIIALATPIGLPDRPSRGRSCDQAARRLIGWPRAGQSGRRRVATSWASAATSQQY